MVLLGPKLNKLPAPALEGLKSFRSQIKPSKLYAAFGGGVGKFGANFAIFHYNKTTIWVDVGMGFENRSYPGIDKYLPNIALAKYMPPDAVILTHAHEDHIGGFPFFMPLIPANTLILTSAFTYSVLRIRLRESGENINRFSFKTVQENSSHKLEDMNLSFFFMPHSIPQVFSLGIEIPHIHKKLYFTSDFKTQGDEPRFHISDIKKYAPVDFLFCDSTGSLVPGVAKEEGVVKKNLEEVLRSHPKKRILVTTFSSHIERIGNLFSLAKKYNRKVGLLGLSLINFLKAGFEAGEFHLDPDTIVSPPHYDKNTLRIISGCQWDDNSSFHRLAHNKLKKLRIDASDILIYSSRIIPGNEEQVYDLLNRISQKSTKVYGIESTDKPLHVSGHGRQGDIKRLLSWLKPKTTVPVHGDHLHFYAFFNFLTDAHIEIFEPHTLYSLYPSTEKEISLEALTGFVEGVEIHWDTSILQARKQMGKEGNCILVVQTKPFQLIHLKYTGVISEGLLSKKHSELFQHADKIISGVFKNQREFPMEQFNVGGKLANQLKSRIAKMNQGILRKKPHISLVWIFNNDIPDS